MPKVPTYIVIPTLNCESGDQWLKRDFAVALAAQMGLTKADVITPNDMAIVSANARIINLTYHDFKEQTPNQYNIQILNDCGIPMDMTDIVVLPRTRINDPHDALPDDMPVIPIDVLPSRISLDDEVRGPHPEVARARQIANERQKPVVYLYIRDVLESHRNKTLEQVLDLAAQTSLLVSTGPRTCKYLEQAIVDLTGSAEPRLSRWQLYQFNANDNLQLGQGTGLAWQYSRSVDESR